MAQNVKNLGFEHFMIFYLLSLRVQTMESSRRIVKQPER